MCFLTFFYIIGTFVGVQVSDFQENVRFCCCIVYIHTLCHFMFAPSTLFLHGFWSLNYALFRSGSHAITVIRALQRWDASCKELGRK